MRRIMLAVLAVLLLIIGNAHAGSWSIHCVNSSCTAEQGALKVYWMEGSGGMYSGKLTGVEGIPISIEDYQTVEKKIESAIEKSITRRKGSDAGVKADTPEVGGPSAGTTGTKENLFTKKKIMSQSKTMGKKININYNLAFIEWLGDTRYGTDRSIKRYWAAAEHALEAYKDGTIETLIESFFVARNAGVVDNIAVNTKLDDENKYLVLTKYVGLTRYPGIDNPEQRYALASRFVYDLAMFPFLAKMATEITEEFRNDLKSLELLTKPGQTALKLYKTNKDLAFAKWLADNNKFNDSIDKMQLQDKYIVAIRVVDKIAKKNLSEADMTFFQEQRNEFESAIKNKDKTVQIITIKGSSISVISVIAVAGGILIAGVVLLVKKRRKSREVINA